MAKLLNNRYRILQTLGAGGCSETFLGEDTHMPSRRKCVIKHLKPVNRDPTRFNIFKQRFEREAAILEMSSQLTIQIPTLHAYFTENNEFYLVQDWIDGKDLSQAIAETGPAREPEVRSLLTGVLKVLDVLHDRGIIHRDLKPANIIPRKSDNLPMLIDFGAVKEVLNTAVDVDGLPVTTTLVIGSLHYMPPEQTLGHPVFGSDLYALGLTAIFMLTGKTPAEWRVAGTSGNAWQAFAPDVSPTLAKVLNKAISSEALDRFASAREMLQALELHDTMIGPPPPIFGSAPSKREEIIIPRGFQPRLLVRLALNAAILLVFFIGFQAYFSQRERKVESAAANRIESIAREQAANSANLKLAAAEGATIKEALNEGQIFHVIRLWNRLPFEVSYSLLNKDGTWGNYSLDAGKVQSYSFQNFGFAIMFDSSVAQGVQEKKYWGPQLSDTVIIGHEPTQAERDSAALHSFDKDLFGNIDLSH